MLGFLAVWFVLNLVFGLASGPLTGEENVSVAWEAHLGGFVFGLLAFSLFDPPADERMRRAREAMSAAAVRGPWGDGGSQTYQRDLWPCGGLGLAVQSIKMDHS